jgi:hypothetical protein
VYNSADDDLKNMETILDSISEAGRSQVSGMTSKTKSGAFDKHCTLCNNKKLGGNSVSRHV